MCQAPPRTWLRVRRAVQFTSDSDFLESSRTSQQVHDESTEMSSQRRDTCYTCSTLLRRKFVTNSYVTCPELERRGQPTASAHHELLRFVSGARVWSCGRDSRLRTSRPLTDISHPWTRHSRQTLLNRWFHAYPCAPTSMNSIAIIAMHPLDHIHQWYTHHETKLVYPLWRLLGS